MTLEDFRQLAAKYKLTLKELHSGYFALSADGYHFVPIGNPETDPLEPEEWENFCISIATQKRKTSEA